MTFDIGPNLSSIGFFGLILWLVVRIAPAIVFLVVALVLFFYVRRSVQQLGLDFSNTQTWISLAVVGLAIALILGSALKH